MLSNPAGRCRRAAWRPQGLSVLDRTQCEEAEKYSKHPSHSRCLLRFDPTLGCEDRDLLCLLSLLRSDCLMLLRLHGLCWVGRVSKQKRIGIVVPILYQTCWFRLSQLPRRRSELCAPMAIASPWKLPQIRQDTSFF